jgi:hypothetical protein
LRITFLKLHSNLYIRAKKTLSRPKIIVDLFYAVT